jgi:hypothetical protein
MTRGGATFLGFVAAPLAAGVANTVLSFAANGPPDDPLDVVAAFVFAAFYSLPVALVAIPIYLLLNRFGLVNLWTCAISGGLLGGAFGAVLRVPNPPQPGDVSVAAGIGVFAAVAFWFVWRAGQVVEN